MGSDDGRRNGEDQTSNGHPRYSDLWAAVENRNLKQSYILEVMGLMAEEWRSLIEGKETQNFANAEQMEIRSMCKKHQALFQQL